MSKTRPEFRISFERQPALVGFDGFRQPSLLLVGAAKEAIVEPVTWVKADGITQLLNRFVILMGEYENRAEVSVATRPQRINVNEPVRFLDRFVVAAHGCKKPGVVPVSVAAVRIEFDGAFEL